ncbi:hypothetical protein Pmani_014396 [Petrolisthes manimaculis]|uniref:Cadherin domain-containing protein n=1 Tax=Petrolisthes manimaculis TaxID=1843537 RepID=A0AAE1PWG0_9EUCA|nr:hypothetical protein Pmani_014396 [Petrolisthes manimaculis]
MLRLSAKVQPPGIPVLYEIIEGNKLGQFWLHPNSGRLALHKPLDYETQTQHILKVQAEALGSTSETEITVCVLDSNDHTPVFPTSLYETQITEEDDHHLPKIILTVTATDSDGGEFGRLSYRLSGNGVDNGYSHSSPHSSFHPYRHSSSHPSFHPSFHSSPHSSFHSSPHSSPHSSFHSSPHSSFHSSPHSSFHSSAVAAFAIDSTTGAIRLLRPLDRDPPYGKAQWRLLVFASDGELEASADIRVNLKDVNDNAPYFPNPNTLTTIYEGSPQGSLVVQLEAIDHDDPLEGHNARVVYSLEKNVIDETTGNPIFTIDSERGIITTSVCCMDREKTQRYALQVVATDGGGLKGTGTVVVEVEDVNDMPPRFSKSEWDVEVVESLTPKHVLATLTVVDLDLTNNFAFRIVAGSGRGWQHFYLATRQTGSVGADLYSLIKLDFENPTHRRGFRFRVEVTDLGEGEEAWLDKYHVDGAWINLRLLDANDNTPIFIHAHAHLTLSEDTPVPTLLTTFTARDVDGVSNSYIY